MTDTLHTEILLVEIGIVASGILSHLSSVIESTFGCKCHSGESLPRPEYAYDQQRNQYAAQTILNKLLQRQGKRILGVVDLDLFVPELNFVFGLADPMQICAVIALPRLRESFYGQHEDQVLFLGRAAKEAIHELGHTYGLEHCKDRVCVMAFSNSLHDTDRKSQRFCKACTSKLQL